MTHDRMFKHDHAHKLDDPERQKWLPAAAVVEKLALEPGTRVADIGAGTGYFAIPMARAGAEVVAVDMQKEMLDMLRSRLAPADRVTLVLGEATKTTLADASVELAFLANVWHEIDDQPAALAEIERVVGPHGRVAIVDWRPDAEQTNGPPRDHRIAASDVVASLRARGWKVESPANIGLYHYVVLASR
jgi:ubiquinone/menaquinone biosynthesis C-methylase UbiE